MRVFIVLCVVQVLFMKELFINLCLFYFVVHMKCTCSLLIVLYYYIKGHSQKQIVR